MYDGTILIVDDEDDILMIMKDKLSIAFPKIKFLTCYSFKDASNISELHNISKEKIKIVPIDKDDMWSLICASNRSQYLKEKVAAQHFI